MESNFTPLETGLAIVTCQQIEYGTYDILGLLKSSHKKPCSFCSGPSILIFGALSYQFVKSDNPETIMLLGYLL